MRETDHTKASNYERHHPYQKPRQSVPVNKCPLGGRYPSPSDPTPDSAHSRATPPTSPPPLDTPLPAAASTSEHGSGNATDDNRTPPASSPEGNDPLSQDAPSDDSRTTEQLGKTSDLLPTRTAHSAEWHLDSITGKAAPQSQDSILPPLTSDRNKIPENTGNSSGSGTNENGTGGTEIPPDNTSGSVPPIPHSTTPCQRKRTSQRPAGRNLVPSHTRSTLIRRLLSGSRMIPFSTRGPRHSKAQNVTGDQDIPMDNISLPRNDNTWDPSMSLRRREKQADHANKSVGWPIGWDARRHSDEDMSSDEEPRDHPASSGAKHNPAMSTSRSSDGLHGVPNNQYSVPPIHRGEARTESPDIELPGGQPLRNQGPLWATQEAFLEAVEKMALNICNNILNKVNPEPQTPARKPGTYDIPSPNDEEASSPSPVGHPYSSPMGSSPPGPHLPRGLSISPDKPRVKTGRKGPEDTLLHRALRNYLKSKRLLSSNPAPPPTDDEVAAFEIDHAGGPTIEQPCVDWVGSFTSDWNKQMFFLLAKDFVSEVQAGKQQPLSYNPETINIENISMLCSRKVTRSRQAFRDSLPPDMEDEETAEEKQQKVRERRRQVAKNARRFSRRQGTFTRRKNAINGRYHENPEFWEQVNQLHSEIGVDGMSSDDSDDEVVSGGRRVKCVRRVAKGWLNPEISMLWRRVEAYGDGRPLVRGNKPYSRLFDATRTNTSSRAVPNLPKNYYNPLWWKTQHEVQQHAMNPQSDKSLPSANLVGRQ